MKSYMKHFFLVVLILLLAGCAGASLKLHFYSAAKLNQDSQNKSLPVEVRIYQLRDSQIFKQATFREIWQQDKATLGNGMVAKKSVTINPGCASVVRFMHKQSARFIGVVAIFREPKSNYWRAIKVLPKDLPLMPINIKVLLSGNKIIIE